MWVSVIMKCILHNLNRNLKTLLFILLLIYAVVVTLCNLSVQNVHILWGKRIGLEMTDVKMSTTSTMGTHRAMATLSIKNNTYVQTQSRTPSPSVGIIISQNSPAIFAGFGKACPLHLTRLHLDTVLIKMNRNMPMDTYLASYMFYCCLVHRPKEVDLPPCPCVPSTLVGELNATITDIMSAASQSEMPNAGGSWQPRDCAARQKVAIIIPYRDRETHLNVLLAHLHVILQRQLMEYAIYVVEQYQPEKFNKASLMNVGYLQARRLGSFDCYIFHDVDVLAENDRSFYSCVNEPRHIAAYLEKYKYRVPYTRLFGGITAFTPEQFELLNGFSNVYYGWGGEDDDMSYRIKYNNMTIMRFPKSVARYRMIVHKRDKLNPRNKFRHTLLKSAKERIIAREGVNTVKFTMVSVTKKERYTHFLVNLPSSTNSLKPEEGDSKIAAKRRGGEKNRLQINKTESSKHLADGNIRERDRKQSELNKYMYMQGYRNKAPVLPMFKVKDKTRNKAES